MNAFFSLHKVQQCDIMFQLLGCVCKINLYSGGLNIFWQLKGSVVTGRWGDVGKWWAGKRQKEEETE